jgi:glycosyltransferase involved in cell wall biosynthesis
LLPSEVENMPNTVIEAMAAGLPIIATPVGALPEMVEDGTTRLLVPIDDASALAGTRASCSSAAFAAQSSPTNSPAAPA